MLCRCEALGELSDPAEDTRLHAGRRLFRAAEGAVVAMATGEVETLPGHG